VFDLSLQQILIRAGACILITAIHGLALAGIARALGDRGPQFDGRLTANPFRHLDPVGAVLMIVVQLGWIRPIAIDPAELRGGRFGLIACVVGSIAATVAGSVLLLKLRTPALTYLPSALVPTIIATLNETIEMCAWFAALNIIPLPPLTGMHLLAAIHPSFTPLMTKYRLYAALALAGLALSGVVRPTLQSVRNAIAGLLPGL